MSAAAVACCALAWSAARASGESEPGATVPGASVRASVERASVRTSERVILTVTVETPKGWKADPVSVEGVLPEGWNVLRSRPGDVAASAAAAGDGVTRSVTVFELEPFLPGKAEIGALTVTLRPEVKQAGAKAELAPITLQTSAVSVEVLSVLPEGTAVEPAEIKGVVDPLTPTNWWVVGSLAAGAVGLGVLAWMVAARLRRAAAERVVTRAAHEIALERLDRLMARGLLGSSLGGMERVKEFFDGASAILREYIEDRFGLRAPERTTEEFLRDARASAKLSENDVEALGRFLNECDMVKFAKAPARAEDGERAAGLVREFIVKTRAAEAKVVVAGPGAVTAPRLAAAGGGVDGEGASR